MRPPAGQADAVQVGPRGIAVPDADALVLQLLGIGAARDEPEQLLSHTCTIQQDHRSTYHLRILLCAVVRLRWLSCQDMDQRNA